MAGETIRVKTTEKRQIIDLTDRVNDQIARYDLQEGICTLFIQHTTAALTVGEVGEGTEEDLLDVLQGMIPKIRFRHAHDPSHAPSHMIASILGPGLSVPIAQGKLALGTWQSVLLVELDGPRERTVRIQFTK
ncbi:MAG TPA: secondary thiamine-phosphate synthase enzyme YjbQ [Nitrospiria bacterium]|nr:secondary thiamine-phosphate synthase enzyme YjbQ [Nitrospiria bacterium]